MKADVTFHVEYDENENHLRISCGNVDGDGLPMPLYMMMLTSLVELQYKINSEKSTNIDQPLSVEERIRKWEEENLPPPTPKTVVTNDNKHKRYTVEEKTEIAMMYASGISLQAIAEKFNRSTASIQKLISNMGVHRGDDLLVPEQGDTTDSKSDRPTTESKGSMLKKPWYLQSQKPNNREKAKHE